MHRYNRFEIDIEIASDGEVKAIVKGVQGKQCGPISAFLDELGIVIEDGDTREAFQQIGIRACERIKIR